MKIALIGNAPARRDCSAEIDAADFVARLNHCAGLGGRYGARIDALFLTPTSAWLFHPLREKAAAACRAARAKIFVAKNFFMTRSRAFREDFDGLDVERLRVAPGRERWTTGTLALAALAEKFPDAEIRLYGFSRTEAEFRDYLSREGPWHLDAAAEETRFRAESGAKYSQP